MAGTNRTGVGIVGLGAIGVTHARVLHRLAKCVELVAFSGGSPAAAAEAGWPDAVQLDVPAVIVHPGVELVVVCSPSAHHARHSLDALAAGRHVVVEKPLALTVADAERIAAEADTRGLMLSMISQRRFEVSHQHVKALLDSGTLGEVRVGHTQAHWWRSDDYYASAAWRSSMSAGGGAVMNQGVHNIDLLQWLCGEATEVTAQSATLGHEIDAEDTTVATVRFASGALGTITVSTATPPGRPATITLQLSAGAVELGQDEILRWEVDGAPPPPGARGISARGGASDPGGIILDGHLAQWRDVLAALDGGRRPAVDAGEAVRTTRLLCAIYEAAATGRTVRPAELR